MFKSEFIKVQGNQTNKERSKEPHSLATRCGQLSKAGTKRLLTLLPAETPFFFPHQSTRLAPFPFKVRPVEGWVEEGVGRPCGVRHNSEFCFLMSACLHHRSQMRVMAVGVASPSATPSRNETCSYASTGQQNKSNGYIRYMYSTCTVVGGHRQLFWLGYQEMKGILVSP